MNIKKTLLSTVILMLAVTAGLAGVQGTWALWSATAPATAHSVQAADFRVELSGTPTTVNGVPTTVTLPNPATALTPSTPVYAAISIRNATNAGGPFNIRATTGEPTIAKASVPALNTALMVHAVPAPASGDCSSASYGPSATAVLAKGESVQLCLRVSLPSDAPETLRGATATITIPIAITQL